MNFEDLKMKVPGFKPIPSGMPGVPAMPGFPDMEFDFDPIFKRFDYSELGWPFTPDGCR